MFTMFIRGIEVRVSGTVDGSDPDVGIMHETFIPETIVRVDSGEQIFTEYEDLTEGEWNDIDAAFWASQPFDPYEHVVRIWVDDEPELLWKD